MINGHKVVTICGSTKFKDEFIRVAERLYRDGCIILTPHIFHHADNVDITCEEKERFDDVHISEIMISDFIYVINVGGYIGSSTRCQIEFAKSKSVEIVYLEPVQ